MAGAVNIDLNTKTFKKKLQALQRTIDDTATSLAQLLLQRMVKEMKEEIAINRSIWQQEGSELMYLDGEDIRYEWNGRTGTIVVGEHTDKIIMEDGAEINPYMFIEFGFGLVGQSHPAKYYKANGWEYNINDHETGWTFRGVDGIDHYSEGNKGINFFYNIINKYRKEWKKIASQSLDQKLKEQGLR